MNNNLPFIKCLHPAGTSLDKDKSVSKSQNLKSPGISGACKEVGVPEPQWQARGGARARPGPGQEEPCPPSLVTPQSSGG